MTNNELLKSSLSTRSDLQPYLFCRGFFITDYEISIDDYPFYGNWIKQPIGNFVVYVHRLQKLTFVEEGGTLCFLIGHAYNPFSGELCEDIILMNILKAKNRQNYIDQLTGIFFIGILYSNQFVMYTDASSLQCACYAYIDGHLYVTSHIRLAGDLLGLKTTDYFNRLIQYHFYHYMLGNYLPGDITCFNEFKRIIPNTCVTYCDGKFLIQRFYPVQKITMADDEETYQTVIREGANIIKSTMELITKKWQNPAISLTGGIDSNTTFAGANGVYDKYETFSYVSMKRESVDAEKAKEISSCFGVKWKCFDIPEDSTSIQDYKIFRMIIEWNGGGFGNVFESDTRKKIVLIQQADFDIEVKSWISETIRAYAYKYFGRSSFPKSMSVRNYTSLYKIFFLNRRLVHETDTFFANYLSNTDLKSHLFNYDESDFFVWEMMHGGKCSLDIGVMKTCFDITVPYNNRNLLDLLLRVPLNKRISDQHHLDMKKILNRELYDMNIHVVNQNETKFRKLLANIYFTINSNLPF